jgi:glycine hydroxymethyltransferase
MSLMNPGEKLLGLDLAHGGHLTHGMRLNFSGKLYEVHAYGVSKEDHRVDMDELRKQAREVRPKVIVAGWSAYPRHLDFAAFREIADEVGAYLWVDMAHFAGLVAAGLHPSPVPHADVVSSTVHKTLGGPRSGLILAKQEYAKKLNSAVFPGQQGGPLMHVIAAKAAAFKIAGTEEFKQRQARTLSGAKILAERLTAADVAGNGVTVLTGGTDVHLVLVDLRNSQMDGQQGEDLLHEVGITVNRNAVPFDPRPPMVTSGLRIGTAALATRGFGDTEFAEVSDIIATALAGKADLAALRARVSKLAQDFPLYDGLEDWKLLG